MFKSFHTKPRNIILILFLLVSSLILSPSSPVHADEETLTLLPHAKHEYRFDYKGDKTQIDIVVDAPDGVELYVYVPGQPDPIGKGSRNKDGLHWSGKFNTPGAYRAVIENTNDGPILYSVAFLGESINNVGMILADTAPSSANVSTQGGRETINVKLPTGNLRLTSPTIPADCTPPNALPPSINTSLKLCPNQIYPSMHLVGNNIGLFDTSHSAVINTGGRQFAVVLEGKGNWLDGVVIQTAPDAADAGAFLCQYDTCEFPTQPTKTILQGGLSYGGGVLLLGANNVVHGITVRGGTIGVATVDGYNNTLVENNLSDLNGWGSFNIRSNNSTYVSNQFNRDNHGCTTPDGYKFESGCETAGWVCLQCNNNLIVRNHCEVSGNCYYMSGERGLASNNNRFVENYCAASPNNCFEFTFSKGNILQDNVTTAHPQTGMACKYPFWIGGSTVYFGKNTWGCVVSPQDSISDAVKSTSVPTVALALGNNDIPFVNTAPPTANASAAAPPSPTTPPTKATQPACRRKYRVGLLFDWDKLTEWVECILAPRIGQ